jgi:divalent metal cation (Fe/Co/Zn/Cd) transporter
MYMCAQTEVVFWLWLTLAYNVAEAVLALWAGNAANSIALLSFGLDSVIETSASVIVIVQLARHGWQTGHHGSNPFTQRLLAVTFWGLAAYILVESTQALISHQAPTPTWWGVGIGLASALFMPLLAWRKIRLGQQLHNPIIVTEAKETLACGMLSVTMLVGLGLHQWLGWWWADPLSAIAMTPWLYREGSHAWHGQTCCH